MIMKIKKIVSGIACMVTLAACNLDYHEYANYGKDYIDESYENVIGMITNVYSILDYDFGQTYSVIPTVSRKLVFCVHIFILI